MYLSDGTERIFVLDGETLKVTDRIKVSDNGEAQKDINELEYANGFIYANIWYSDDLIKIDPITGEIVKRYDFSVLRTAEISYQEDQKNFYEANVLNGVAYDPIQDVFYLSGKNWHQIFKVKLN